MAVLFGELRPDLDEPNDRLPTEHELPPDQRIELEIGRVNSLLHRLGALLPENPNTEVPRVAPAPAGRFHEDLEKTNLDILKWLACAGREFGLAYQLGRSLRDTANPPLRIAKSTGDAGTHDAERADADSALLTAAWKKEIAARASTIQTAKSREAQPIMANLRDATKVEVESADAQALQEVAVAARDAVTKQLSRSRVSKLQEWLSILAPRLPADSAAIVSASIGRWCDLVTTVFDPKSPGRLRRFGSQSQWDVAFELLYSLLPQGDAWLNLLVGAESADGLLTPEGFVAAGEAALGRTTRIVRKIVIHYWFALVILIAVLAGVLYIAAQDLSGAGKAWTQIAAVAGALGFTTKRIGTTMARLSKNAEKPIFGIEKIDAMAWAVTSIPAELKLNNRGVRALRRSGIARSSPLGRA